MKRIECPRCGGWGKLDKNGNPAGPFGRECHSCSGLGSIPGAVAADSLLMLVLLDRLITQAESPGQLKNDVVINDRQLYGRIKSVVASAKEQREHVPEKSCPTWISVEESLPDADISVMTYAPDSSDPVWPGFHDGEAWYSICGLPIIMHVTHWRDFPEPPTGERQS